nr:exodeoxyribonuclease V subunit gamma [uncultured Desulfobulbus sp.]
MFLYQSNRLEYLFAALAHNLAQPVEDPLEPEIIVVQNQGMAQWVSRQLALHNGIAANLQFPLPGRCIWDLYDRLSAEIASDDLFQASLLRWRIFALLPQLLGEPGFAAPAAYLADDSEQNRLYQLSGKIADVFDQYQVYRPDLLELWQAGEEDHWQAVLWRTLAQIGEAERVALASWWRQQLEQGAPERGLLPGRLHLFGLNALAPVYLEIFAQVGQLFPLHLYHLSPCQQYWGDLVSGRQQAAMRAKGKSVGEEWYHEVGHPLLSSLGRTGQEFFQQLQQYQMEEVDLYHPAEEDYLLAVLQNDILSLEDRSQNPEFRYHCATDDRSIQLHCCFSPLREIQVLHDRLLDLLAAQPDLTPGDILVSAPNIERYSEAIAGVFGETLPEHRIPWSLADQSFVREQPAVRCFLELLQLLESRCTAPEVMALCEHPLVLARFGLESAQLSQLNRWVQSAGIRWGLDGAHREELEVNAGEMHSWQFGLDRLLLGYCMGTVAGNVEGLLPYGEIAMGEAEALGGFGQLISTLGHWQHAVRKARPPEQWCADLLLLLADFFATEGEDPGLALLRETIIKMGNDFRLAEFSAQLPYAVLRSHLQEQFSQTSGGQPFLSGRVTFCNMVPMRSVPFRVICLLGMGDQEFPRSQRPPSFDLMANSPRLGDRNRRNDDRYLFLEALLSARDVLYLSWVGRSLRDESQIPPSVVISELCDYIDASATGGEAIGTPLSEQLTTEHPMHPFSRRCYTGTPNLGSYNPAWLPALSIEDPPPFWTTRFTQTVPEEVELDQLIRFWRHPTRFFLEQGLGMRLRTEDVALTETEPFTLNGLEQYLLRQETIVSRMQERDPQQWAEGLQGSGRLPQAGFGRVLFTAIDQEAEEFAEILTPLMQEPQEPLEIDLVLDSFRLRGWLRDLYGGTRVSWRSGRLRGGDLMEWWINHLCLNLLAAGIEERTSYYVSWEKVKKQKVVTINRLMPVQQPLDILQRLLTLCAHGWCRPLLFFPETSLAWAAAKEGAELEAARKQWEGNYMLPGEGDEAAYGYLYRSFEDILGEEFAELTEIYSQILAHMEVVDAAA